MRLSIILILISTFSIMTIAFFISLGEMFLGFILSGIMFIWPIGFWALSKVGEGWGKTKAVEAPIAQEVADKPRQVPEPPKKDLNVARDDLQRLRKVSETLDQEMKEGILSERTYSELKKQNDEAIERLEKEIR